MNAPTIIRQTNERLHCAIVCARLAGRNPATIGEVRDAINARRNQRTQDDPAFRVRFADECAKDLRAYGRMERTFSELYQAAQ